MSHFARLVPAALSALVGVFGATRLLAEPLTPAASGKPLAAEVALAVVYDTSGSMRGTVPGTDGQPVPKHIAAKRAFTAVIARLETFTRSGIVTPPTKDATPTVEPAAPGGAPVAPTPPATAAPASAPKRLDVGIYQFDGSKAREAVALAPFSATALRDWLARLPSPGDSTPLGDTMALAGRALLASPAASKHILVITDGENTSGIAPVVALERLQKDALAREQPIFVHVIALDIPPKVFAALRKQGATLIGAADEKQLQSQLDFILENQILLEAP